MKELFFFILLITGILCYSINDMKLETNTNLTNFYYADNDCNIKSGKAYIIKLDELYVMTPVVFYSTRMLCKSHQLINHTLTIEFPKKKIDFYFRHKNVFPY